MNWNDWFPGFNLQPSNAKGAGARRRAGHLTTESIGLRVMLMNLIRYLFGRHPHQERAESSTYNWPGQSGKEYPYEIYPVDAAFKPWPGNYIYAKQLADGDWAPIYIAQTRDLHQRLEGNVSLADAMANGATHVHAHYSTTGQSGRHDEERDLVQRWHPVCNAAFQS